MRTARHAALLFALLLALCSSASSAEEAKNPEAVSLETVQGKHGREQLENQLAKRVYGGKTFAWSQYSAWGHDLLVKGFVDAPPAGPAPSPRISQHFRCVHCHDLVREDKALASQDPEAREQMLRSAPPSQAEKRDGSVPSLVPGTTFWGAVNRTRFYNGFYTKYNSLKVADGNPMNPERLTDAIQICSRFCSAGRYPEAWEMDSMLAYLWDLEVRVSDLDLTPDARQKVTAAVGGGDPKALEEARALVSSAYLKVSKADVHEKPKDMKGNVDVYAGGKSVAGDAARGELVFKASCGGCHGQDVAAPSVGKLARRAKEDQGFYRAPMSGTERRGGPYMPVFTTQRLSQRQLADIRAYLSSLKTGG